MKDGVDRSEGIEESKGEGMGAGLCNDVVGTEILFRELLQRTGGAEVLSFDKYFIADFEIQCQRLVFIGSDLVSFLSVRVNALVSSYLCHYIPQSQINPFFQVPPT